MHGRALAAACFALLFPGAAHAASYQSAGGDLELRQSGSTVELVRAGGVVASDAAGAPWVITGADGVADTLTIRNPDGGILAARVDFDGGDGAGIDTLRLRGGRSDSASTTPDGADAGTIVHRSGDDQLVVAYAGLEPVVDTVPAGLF